MVYAIQVLAYSKSHILAYNMTSFILLELLISFYVLHDLVTVTCDLICDSCNSHV